MTSYNDLLPEDIRLLNQNINKSLKSASKARMRGYQDKLKICAEELKPVYQRSKFQYEDRDALCSQPNHHDMLKGVHNLDNIDSDYESERDFFKRTKIKLRRPIISREVEIQQIPRLSYNNRRNRNIQNKNSSDSNESDESSDSGNTNQQIGSPQQSVSHSQSSHFSQVNGSQFSMPGAPFEEFNSQVEGNVLVPQSNVINSQENNGQIIPLQEEQGNGRGEHNPREQRNRHRNRNHGNNDNNNQNNNNNNQDNNIISFSQVDEPGTYLRISTFNNYMNRFVGQINQGMHQVEQNIRTDLQTMNAKIDRIFTLLNGQ